MTAAFEPARKVPVHFAPSAPHTKRPLAGLFVCGAEGRVRTADPLFFRQMLYQLSYLSISARR